MGKPMSPHPSSRTFFHCRSADDDPHLLLDPDRQFTEPWGDSNHGPCDKCEGGGISPYECLSCVERGADADCPSCQGRVRFEGTCPACLGEGEISHTRRRGIAVFPSREGLYLYLATRDANVEGKAIVELEGEVSDEIDLDADAGALLALPERIVTVEPLDLELIRALESRFDVRQPASKGKDCHDYEEEGVR